MALYKGYSSFEYQRTKTVRLIDIELVKLNLLNHMFTKRGERVKMPNFGTLIPELTFEPLDDQTISIMEEQIASVIDYDPRVRLLDLTTLPEFDNNTVTVHVKLEFLEFDIVDDMDLHLEFEG
jgi:phage baseplate assembly protein W